MIDPRTLVKIDSINDRTWGTIYKELVLYATYKLRKAGFEVRTEKDSVDAEHFAVLAVEKLMDGTRAWDFDRFPDLTIHLKGIVKSLISSHFKETTRSKISLRIQQATVYDESEDLIIETIDADTAYDEATLSGEEIIISKELWASIEKAFGEFKDDYLIFSEWIEGSPPREISEALDIPIKEIYNSIKKGRRIVKTLFNKKS